MGRKMVYVATALSDYRKIEKDDSRELIDFLDSEQMFDWLDRTPEGVDFVDEIQGVDEFDGGYGWLRHNPALKFEETADVFKIVFNSISSKEEWFRKPYEAYLKDLQDVLAGACLKNFAKYELLCPDYKLKLMYSRQWEGYVAVVNARGDLMELDYPMEFLRQMKPRQTWIVSKKGWTYK